MPNPVKKKFALVPKEYDEVSLVDSGGAQHAHVVIYKRSQEEPCDDTENKTGKKDGKSKRSKNFKEERHKRDEKGRMKETSKESKQKYGKGGTTESKLDAACDDEDKPNKKNEKKKRKGKVSKMSVIEKRKTVFSCADCGDTSDVEIEKCENEDCESEDIKKQLIVVRKSDFPKADDEEDETDELEEDEVPAPAKKKKKVSKVSDPDDEEEEDEEDEEDSVALKKSDHSRLGLEVFSVSTALAEDIHKVFTDDNISKRRGDYEDVMTQFNEVMDSAAERWFSGSTIAKSADEEKEYATEIQKRVGKITQEEVMTRPDAVSKKLDEVPAEIRSYIETLEGGNIEKNDPYADLPEEVQKSLKRADDLVEKAEVDKWDSIAKGYTHFPGDKSNLAQTLRSLSDSNPEAFTELKKTLDAAEHNLEQSDIFKSYGAPGGGTNDDDAKIAKRRTDAEELVSKGEFTTIEQAEVHLMGADDYEATAQ